MIRLGFVHRGLQLSTPHRLGGLGDVSILGRLQLAHYTHGHSLPAAPRIVALVTPEDVAQARSWVAKFKEETISRGSVELTFSRSSGPGGQHVNKVNTKATLRCPIDSAWIPAWAQTYLKNNPHYVASTNSILIMSTVYRSQSENVEDCLSKLHTIILTASSAPIKNEPSPEQKKRVEVLERIEKARRRLEKSHRSEIKNNRKKGGWD